MEYQRLLTVQDISCLGQCSMTVALPILSACGHETCILPTMMLSTHTGGFVDVHKQELTDQFPGILEHWKRSGIVFDGVYTGYLGKAEQIDWVRKIFSEMVVENGRRIVDPAMADGGKLYGGFEDDYVQAMKRLCADADVIIPNITEACLLLGKEFKNEGEYDEAYIKALVDGFLALGIKTVVITGVKYGDGRHGAMAYDSNTCEYKYLYGENLDCAFHGTGDIFSSVLCGALTKGVNVYDATQQAVDFTIACIKQTLPEREKYPYGVKFEECLNLLTK